MPTNHFKEYKKHKQTSHIALYFQLPSIVKIVSKQCLPGSPNHAGVPGVRDTCLSMLVQVVPDFQHASIMPAVSKFQTFEYFPITKGLRGCHFHPESTRSKRLLGMYSKYQATTATSSLVLNEVLGDPSSSNHNFIRRAPNGRG